MFSGRFPETPSRTYRERLRVQNQGGKEILNGENPLTLRRLLIFVFFLRFSLSCLTEEFNHLLFIFLNSFCLTRIVVDSAEPVFIQSILILTTLSIILLKEALAPEIVPIYVLSLVVQIPLLF